MQLVHSIRQDLTRLAQADLSGLLIKTGLAIPHVPWNSVPPGPTCPRQFGGGAPTSPAAVCRAMVTMHSGDTVVSVASRYKISAYTLMLDNHISNPNLIFPGQVLCVR